jgi:hypothetical protein
MTEHHDGSGDEHDTPGATVPDTDSPSAGSAPSTSDGNGSDDHEPASPGGTADTGPDPYDIESDLGPDGVPTTEPEPGSE